MTISRELLDELLSGVERPEDLLGDKGLMKELKVRLMERMLGAELTGHLVHELMEARDERRLLRLQKQMANCKLLIIDELGFVPLSKTGAEVLFELISQRYERGATLITSNLPFDEWTETFGSERLTGALLDRLTHHVNILEMNGDSYRLAQSRGRPLPQCDHLACKSKSLDRIDPPGLSSFKTFSFPISNKQHTN